MTRGDIDRVSIINCEAKSTRCVRTMRHKKNSKSRKTVVDFTTVFVAGAKVLPEDYRHLRTDYWHRKLKGFGLRVANSGRKSWFVTYRYHGVRRRLALGTYPAMSLANAKAAALVELGKVAGGKDPSVERAAQRVAEKAQSGGAGSFEAVARLWLEERVTKLRKATRDQYNYVVEQRLIPAWAGRAVKSIGREDVKAVIKVIRDEGKDPMANRLTAVVRSLFNWVVKEHPQLLDRSPTVKLDQTREDPRTVVLRDSEIRTLWEALDREPLSKAAYFKLCLLTAQRKNEVLAMAWAELDLEARWWTIPAARTKNGREHRVYLGPQAFELVSSIRVAAPAGSTHVFPGQRLGQPKTNPTEWINDIREKTGVALRLHDLRRTSATLLARNGIRAETISRVINHKLPGELARTYDQASHDPEKRTGLIKLDGIIKRIVEGRADEKVVALHA